MLKGEAAALSKSAMYGTQAHAQMMKLTADSYRSEDLYHRLQASDTDIEGNCTKQPRSELVEEKHNQG
tara:strand:+ start:475 stop:678 length:204 start_codon:yes stop_codon:yes gene_type:complete